MNKTYLACLLGGLSLGLLAGCQGRSAAPQKGAITPASRSIEAVSTAPSALSAPVAAPAPSTLSNPKIAPRLAAMARQVKATASGSQAAALTTTMVRVNKNHEIQVYIHVNRLAPEIKASIGKAGAITIRASKPLGLYQAWASPGALERIANLPAVTKIDLPVYGFPGAGR